MEETEVTDMGWAVGEDAGDRGYQKQGNSFISSKKWSHSVS